MSGKDEIMKLYGTPPTRATKVLWVLRELGLDCEIVFVSLRRGDHRVLTRPYGSPTMETMDEEQYDTLLNGILGLGTGQRRLTRLLLELAQTSAEQEERLEQVIEVLRKMGNTSTSTQQRISTLESEIAELKKKAS